MNTEEIEKKLKCFDKIIDENLEYCKTYHKDVVYDKEEKNLKFLRNWLMNKIKTSEQIKEHNKLVGEDKI